jgi:O-antigen/teichoic acid export membrane protein
VIALTSGLLVWLVSIVADRGLGLGATAGLGLPLALAVMAVQWHDYVRRYFFARGRVKAAFLIDIVRFALQFVGIVAIGHLSLEKTAASGLWIVAVACGFGGAAGAVLLDKLAWNGEVFREVQWRHWRFSRWLLPSILINAAMRQVFPLAAGWLLGVAAIGLMNIGQTALGFITVLLLAVNNFAPVQASRTLHLAGRAALRRYIGQLGLTTMLIAAAIVAAILLFPALLIRIFYGPAFIEAAFVVRWLAVAQFLYSASTVLIIWASANEMTKTIFYSYTGAAAVALIGTFPLAHFAGLSGILLCMLASEIVRLLILSVLLFVEDADARRQEARKGSAFWTAEPARSEITEP